MAKAPTKKTRRLQPPTNRNGEVPYASLGQFLSPMAQAALQQLATHAQIKDEPKTAAKQWFLVTVPDDADAELSTHQSLPQLLEHIQGLENAQQCAIHVFYGWRSEVERTENAPYRYFLRTPDGSAHSITPKPGELVTITDGHLGITEVFSDEDADLPDTASEILADEPA